MPTRVSPRQISDTDPTRTLKKRLEELGLMRGEVETASQLPTLQGDVAALQYVKDEKKFYTWQGATIGWEAMGAQGAGLTDDQQAAIGLNIFDPTVESSEVSLDGRIGALTDEVLTARGTKLSLNERLNSMSGTVEQSAVMIDEHNRYFKDELKDYQYADMFASKDIVIQGGYLSALKGGKAEDLFDTLDMVDTVNSMNIDTTFIGDIRLKDTYTNGFFLSKSFQTGGTNRAVLEVEDTLPSQYAWGTRKLAYTSAYNYHMYHTSTCIDKNNRRWVFFQNSVNNGIYYYILNEDETVFKNITGAYTSYNNYFPKCKVGHDGTIYLLFHNSSYGWMDMWFNPNGSISKGATQLWSPTTGAGSSHGDIVVDGSGKIWYFLSGAANTNPAAGSTSAAIFVVRNPDYSSYGSKAITIPTTEGARVNPAAAVDANGRIWVTYFNGVANSYGSGNNSSIEIWTTIYNPDMSEYKSAFKVNNGGITRHVAHVSAAMIATPTEMQLFYNEGGAIFMQRFNLSGGFLNSTYAHNKSWYQHFGTGSYSSYNGIGNAYGFRFTMLRDGTFQGYAGITASTSTSSGYAPNFEFILMKKESGSWVKKHAQSFSSTYGNTGAVWHYPSANYNIVMKEGEEWAVLIRGTTTYAKLWFNNASAPWVNGSYGPLQYNASVTADPSKLENIMTWGWSLTGIGLLIGDSLSAYDTTGNIHGMYQSAIYDKVDDRTYVAVAKNYENNPQTDVYVAHVDKAATYGKPLEEKRITSTSTHFENHLCLTRDYTNSKIFLDWTGVDVSYSNNYQTYTSVLQETKAEIKYFLSNDEGVNWIPSTPGEPVSFASVGDKIRFKAEFWSPEAGVVPKLLGYSISEWNTTAGEMIAEFHSEQLPSTAPITRATLNVNHKLRGTGNIVYHLSNDGGFTWKEAVPGKAIHFDNPDSSDLRVKAVITIPASELLSPVIEDYAVTSTSVPTFDQVRKLQVNMANMMFDMNMAGILSKSNLKDTVADTFEDTSGIDLTKMKGLSHDPSRGLFALSALKYPLHSDGSVATSSVGFWNANYDISNIIDNNLSPSYTDMSYWLQQISSDWDGRVAGRPGATLDITFPEMREIGPVNLYMYTSNGGTHGYCDHQIEVYNPDAGSWEIVVPKVTLSHELDLGPTGDGWWRYNVNVPYKTNKVRVRVWAKTTYGTITEVQISPPVSTMGEIQSQGVTALQNVISAMLVVDQKKPTGSTIGYQMTNNLGATTSHTDTFDGDGTTTGFTLLNTPVKALTNVSITRNIIENLNRDSTLSYDSLANDVLTLHSVTQKKANTQSFTGGNAGLMLTLSNKPIVNGTLTVSADNVKDGLVTSKVLLVEGTDYTVDYTNGRVTLNVATDTLADSVIVDYQYLVSYVEGTDFIINARSVEWLATGTAPLAGQAYQANYDYKDTQVIGTNVSIVNAENGTIEFAVAPPTGTGNIEVNYSKDAAVWADVTPETQFTFPTVGSKLAVRAVVNKGNATSSPELSAWGWMW